MLLGGGGDEGEPLGVADDLRGVEGVVDRLHEPVVGVDPGLRPGEQRRRRRPVLGERRDHPGVDRLGDQGGGRSQVHRGDDRPLAGALLPGGVEDLLNPGPGLVDDGEDGGGDLDQERPEHPAVPLPEDRCHLGVSQPQAGAEQVVRLGDELHVAVLDAVVHHLHVVPRAVGPDPVAAGDPFRGGGGDRGEHPGHLGPGRARAARHDRGPVTGALLSPRDAGPDEPQPGCFSGGSAADGVGEQRVAAVDDDVSRIEQRHQPFDEGVDRVAGLHHQHDLARSRQHSHQLLQRPCRHDLGPVALAGGERLGHRRRAVVDGDAVAVVGEVEDQVLAHDGQADEPDVGVGDGCHPATVSAGQEA